MKSRTDFLPFIFRFKTLGENAEVISRPPTGDSVVATNHSRVLARVASAGFVLTGIVNTFLGPILPVLAAQWHLSDSQSGYFFATQFLGTILGVSLSSVLLPLRGFRFSIALAYVLMAVGVRGLALPEWRSALLATLVFGLGLGLGIPATNVLISSVSPGRRASALSILNFCWGLGAVLAPFALSIAMNQNHVTTFVSLLSGLLLLVTLSLAFAKEGDQLRSEKQSAGGRQVFSNWPSVAIVGGMFFLYVAVESSVGGWIATLVERAPSGVGRTWVLAPSLFWGGLLAGRGIVPLLLKRMRERTLALASLVVATAGMCVLVLSSPWQWLTAAGLVVGFGLAAVFPITIALLSRFQEMEKRIAGPMFALAGLGGTTMPWLVGAISTSFGSLHTGLIAPLLGSGLLLWLHVIGNDEGQHVDA